MTRSGPFGGERRIHDVAQDVVPFLEAVREGSRGESAADVVAAAVAENRKLYERRQEATTRIVPWLVVAGLNTAGKISEVIPWLSSGPERTVDREHVYGALATLVGSNILIRNEGGTTGSLFDTYEINPEHTNASQFDEPQEGAALTPGQQLVRGVREFVEAKGDMIARRSVLPGLLHEIVQPPAADYTSPQQ